MILFDWGSAEIGVFLMGKSFYTVFDVLFFVIFLW